MSAGLLFWGVFFSSVGLGYFLYGRKQSAVIPLCSGLVLMIYPFFVSNVLILVVIGVILIAVPWFVKV